MKLIDKEILLLKIDSKIEEAQKVFNVVPSSVIGGMIEGYTRTKKIISSLEVKEVDLCKEEERIWKDFNMGERHLSKNDLEKISKYFFELGLKAQKEEKV